MAVPQYSKYGLSPVADYHGYGLQPVQEGEPSASSDLLAQAGTQQFVPPPPGAPQAQEQYSNPTAWPGFNNLSQKEKLQRIALGQVDPANQSPTGGYVPGGTYESPVSSAIASAAPLALQPEIGLGEGLLSKYVGEPILNSLGRIGAGTASNIAWNAPNINSQADFTNVAKPAAVMNTMLEGATLPFRLPAYLAEMSNPLNYAADKAGQIGKEYKAAKATMDEMYRPINQKYGAEKVTTNPLQYLSNVGIERKGLYTNAKDVYDDFVKNPTYENLSKLKSQVGRDYARISIVPDKVNKAQLFERHQNSINQLKKDFLSGDKNALNQLNLADSYASKNYFPFLSTPTLRKVVKGNLDVTPSSLSKSIKKGTEKTVGIGSGERSVIPEGHPLRRHMNDLDKFMNFGNAAQVAIPGIAGAVGGELLHPGLGGVIGGAGAALGASQASKMASKFGAPNLTNFMQNPLIQGIFQKTAPWWYGGGRALINTRYSNSRK